MIGFVWLEKIGKENQGESLPIVKVFEDINNSSYTNLTGHPFGIEISQNGQRSILIRISNLPDVQWFVMGDDDIVFAANCLL